MLVESAAQRLDDACTQALAVVLGACVQQRNAAREVVEDQQGFRRHVHRLGEAFELAAVRRQPLEEAHDVVARGADEAAVERDAIDLGRERRSSMQHVAHERKPAGRIARPRLVLTVDREPIGIELEREPRA